MSDARKNYLSDPTYHVEHSDHNKVVPSWLLKEAQTEEPWEKAYKENLEVEAFAREFRNKFLEDYKIENRQTVQQWRPEAAATWLTAKAKINGEYCEVRARKILETSGAIDEKRTEVISQIAAAQAEKPSKKQEDGSPSAALGDEKTPARISDVELEKSEQNLKDAKKLRKKRAVAGYGIVLTEDSCLLYKTGSKVSELNVEECGGFEVLAEEIDSIDTEKDVQALFMLTDDEAEVSKQGWFTPKTPHKTAGPQIDWPAYRRDYETSLPDTEKHEFDPAHVDQHTQKGRDASDDPGPASLVPGAKAIAPGIPDGDGSGSSVTTG